MNKELEKCLCGKELDKYGVRFVLDPIKQEFVCPQCWEADKEKKITETETCCRCGKLLDGKDFIDHRLCLAPNSESKTVWGLFCIECEPYTETVEHH